MPSLNDYLKKLLYQYDCVVVPELGAFLTHYQPASFSETAGQYLPPRKRVAFNEALRLDDGILLNYVMLHERIGREQAQRQVGQFVSEIRQQVAAQGRFDLDNIGSFSQNDEGRLQFEPGLRHNFFGESYGMSAIAAVALDRKLKTEPALDAIPITALGPVLVRDQDVTYLPVRRNQHWHRAGWRVAAAVLLVGSVGLISYFSVLDPGQPFQSGIDPANMLRLPQGWLERTSPDTEATSANKVLTVPVSTHEPVSAPAVITPEAVAMPAPVAAVTPAPVVAAAPKPVAKRVVTPAPTVVVPVVVSAPDPVPTPPVAAARPKTSGPFFTIIAGSFSSKANAYRLRSTLQKAGYTDAYVIPPTARKPLYKVAASGSVSADEATADADSISALLGAKAWIMRH